MTKDILDKYIWLVDTIHQAGRITLAEINEKSATAATSRGGHSTTGRTRFRTHLTSTSSATGAADTATTSSTRRT